MNNINKALKDKNYDDIEKYLSEPPNIFILKDLATKKNKKLFTFLHQKGFDLMLNNGILLLDSSISLQKDNLKIILSQAPHNYEYLPLVFSNLINFIKNEKKDLKEQKVVDCILLFFEKMDDLKLMDFLKLNQEDTIFLEDLFINHKLQIQHNEHTKKIKKI